MAQVKNAKEALDQAVTSFNCCKSALSKVLNNSDAKINERALKNKMQKLDEALTKLNTAHTLWISKADLDDEALIAEKCNFEWLENQWSIVSDLQDKFEETLSSCNEDLEAPAQKQKLRLYLKQMETLQLDIQNKLKHLSSKQLTELTTASHKSYFDILTNIKSSIDGQFDHLMQNILVLDVGDFDKNLNAFEGFRQEQQTCITNIELQLAENIPVPPSKPSSTGVGTRTVEMEKSVAPSFSGKTIEYPEFKKGWMKVAGSAWDDGNQVEQMKRKVDDETRRIISRCNTMEEVWEALDREYAQEQEVINAVVVELHNLKAGNCSTAEYIIKLRNHLPNLEEALKAVDGLEHLCSPERVHFLTDKFDDTTLHEWDYHHSKTKGSTYDRFFNFLLDRYDAAKTFIARERSRSLNNSSTNSRCNTNALQSRISSNQTMNHLAVSEGDCRRCQKWVVREDVHTCPGCGRGTVKNDKISHCLEHCGIYMSMSSNEKSDCVQNAKWCPIHLLGGHELNDCNMRNDPRFVCGISGCQKHHHKSLHGSTTAFVAGINTIQVSKRSLSHDKAHVLLAIQDIETTTGTVTSFYDNGSTCCLITYDTADRMNLIGEPVLIGMKTLTGYSELDSHKFELVLVDISGNLHPTTMYGVERISARIGTVDLSNVKSEFSKEFQDKWDLICNRPSGEIDVLIGEDVAGLHPSKVEVQGNLKVMSSMFGTGYLLAGSHPLIESEKVDWSESVSHIRYSTIQKLDISPERSFSTAISIKPKRDFFEVEGLGVEPPRRCGNCQNCKECSFRGQQLSQKEQYEYHVIESKVFYDKVLGCFRVEYAFLEDPYVLSNNIGQVIKIAVREETKLIRDGELEDFNGELMKMIVLRALVEITKEEDESWDGPRHYNSLHLVLKADSPTTPHRIVSNSSLSDKRGKSLNSILMKGPNALSNLFQVLIRWRMYVVAFCSDITKAYFSLRTGSVEKHIRRVVWRFGDTSKPWRIFGFATVSFGDRPAAVLLEIAIKKTAQMHWSWDPEASYRITNDRYVDDLASGGSLEEVSRFVGQEAEDFKCDGTIPTILARGSMQLKVIVTSGETNKEKLAKLGNAVLGVGWNAPDDTISINLGTINLSKKKKCSSAILNLSSIGTADLTPRNLLSIINGIFDPIGLITPITIRLKAAFRDLFRSNHDLKWDEAICPVDQNIWMELVKMLSQTNSIEFPRSTKPQNAKGKCQLVCYFDGSDTAYAGVIYARWVLNDGSVIVKLVASKSRVNPLKRISTPRSELNGAVLTMRLLLSVLESISISGEVPERTWIIGDSECTLACIEKVSAPFGEYFGNRIGEILDTQAKVERFCPVGENGEWWHTGSKNNAADIATRLDTSSCQIGLNSEWQNGPPYLKRPFSEWPINRDFSQRKEDCIPQGEVLKRYRCLVQNIQAAVVVGIDQLLDPYSTNDWDKLINKTQFLILVGHKFRKIQSDTASRITHAKTLWFRTAMNDTVEAIQKNRLRELDIRDHDGMKVIVGRAQTGLQKFFGKDSLPVIMGSTRVAKLVMLKAHFEDHTGRDTTMANARHEAWIVNAKSLAKPIVKSCVRCRFLRKLLEGQKMAKLPSSIQVPCPPFSNIGLDLCGPHTVKSMTNKRATMKVWVVIFLCLNTKAISFELAPGYSTDNFLLAYWNHVHTRGSPIFVHSDRGSQLVAASKEVSDQPLLQYDWDEIAASTSLQGTTWAFCPAGGQWRNGAAEAFVKKFKKSFYHLYNDTKMNYAELLCAVKRIGNILNDRPVSAQRTKNDDNDEDFLTPLTPNMLLTGRSKSGPPKDFLSEEDPQLHLNFIDELERAWWYQYKVQYFHSLVPTRKWIDAKRNICLGDIVLVEYRTKSAPGTYRLGKVVNVETDADGLVRTCNVQYKLVRPITDKNRSTVQDVVTKEVRLPVQRLVLILPVEEQ